MSRTIRVGDRVTCLAHSGIWTVIQMIRANDLYVRRAVIEQTYPLLDGPHRSERTVAADILRHAR